MPVPVLSGGGEDGERIHQNIVVSSERDTFLYRRQIGRAQKAFPFQDGLGIHFGTGGNDACGVELYLIKYPVYIQLFHPHTGEGGIVVACRLPGCQLSSQKMVYRLIHITCFCSLIWWEGVKVGIFEGSWITGIFFAMATVFYIVGASFSLSLEKPFRTYLKGRIKRVAIPYWKYALVCFPAVVYHYWKSGEIIPLNDFISYVFFTPTVEYRLFDHIWFIPPYLIISLCLPFYAG